VGPSTGAALGLDWPKIGAPVASWISPVPQPDGPTPVVARPASAQNGAEAELPANFRSLTPGGIYSSEPFDLSVKRSIRTNNPGALNATKWQRNFPGFAGITQPDGAGNRTTIYATPEHGIAAWHHLLTNIYGYGQDGAIRIQALARKYAGVDDEDHPAVAAYVAGWGKWSGKKLTKASEVRLDQDPDMLLLAKGMFGHEAGGKAPWHDDQVINALTLKRNGKLPAT
jgi:D-alanyl-D-alanine carboxypeptidase